MVYRQGNETIEEAHTRDAKPPEDRRPKPKTKPKTPKAPAPTAKTTSEIEFALVEILSSPTYAAAMQGDEWAVKHFDREAPVLARNLAAASEKSPWLRRKLELLLVADDLMFAKVLALIPVVTAAVAYLLPPVIYYLDPPFIPDGARERFAVPDRKALKAERKRQEEQRAEAAEAAEAAAGAEPAAAAEPPPAA